MICSPMKTDLCFMGEHFFFSVLRGLLSGGIEGQEEEHAADRSGDQVEVLIVNIKQGTKQFIPGWRPSKQDHRQQAARPQQPDQTKRQSHGQADPTASCFQFHRGQPLQKCHESNHSGQHRSSQIQAAIQIPSAQIVSPKTPRFDFGLKPDHSASPKSGSQNQENRRYCHLFSGYPKLWLRPIEQGRHVHLQRPGDSLQLLQIGLGGSRFP